MHTIRSFFALTSVLVGVGGCATVVDPKILREAQSTSPVQLTRDLLHTRGDLYAKLLAGRYTPELEDELGVYYRCDGVCVLQGWSYRSSPFWSSSGGLWISKDSSKRQYRIYYYPSTNVASASPEGVPSYSTAATQVAAAPPGASLGQVAIGASIGVAIVGAVAASQRDKILFFPDWASGSTFDTFVFQAK